VVLYRNASPAPRLCSSAITLTAYEDISRCVRIESDERGRLRLDPERAALVKHVVAAGILEEINALEGAFPKKNQTAIDEIVERYGAPRK
jgi:hypothetical protein